MSCYYIHKVGHQEMGSVRSRGDKPSRGRYFLISKSCLEFFPHISSVVMNDKIVLTIIPMLEGEDEKKVYCTMDYHNQKYADISYRGSNPRNEIRLYMNNSIDPDKEYFFKDDLAVFEKFVIGKDSVYTLTRISPTSTNYKNLLDLVKTRDTRFKSNILLEGDEWDFDFIKRPDFDEISEVVLTKEAKDVIEKETTSILDRELFDTTEWDEQDEDKKTREEFDDTGDTSFEDSMGSSFFTSSSFHDFVMNAYEYKCAVTRKVIRYKEGKIDLLNLEAAHIKPQAHEGTFLPCNGIAMSRDMHFAFDKGFFTLSDDYTIIVSEKIKDSWLYREYNGHKIFIPKEPYFRPQLRYLRHHRENVFDTFRQIRKLTREKTIDKNFHYPEPEDECQKAADESSACYGKKL